MKTPLISTLLVLASSPLFAQHSRPPVQLDNAGTISGLAVASADGVSAVLWKEDATQNIMFAVSSNFGTTWSSPIRLDSDSTGAFKDTEDWSLLIDGSRIYAAWWDDRLVAGGGTSEVFVASSTNLGVSWNSDERGTYHYTPSIAEMEQWHWSIDFQTVCIATIDTRYDLSNREELVLHGSQDGGQTFTPWFVIYPGATGSDMDLVRIHTSILSGSPLIDVVMVNNVNDMANNRNDVLWTRYDLQANSQLPAVNLSPGVRALNGDVQHVGTEISLSAIYPTIAMAFTADFPTSPGKDEIFVNRYNGSAWSGDSRVGNYPIGAADVDHPVVLESQGALVAAWEDDRLNPGVEDSIWVAYSQDFGTTWIESGPFGPGGNPHLQGNGGYVGVSFTNLASPDDPQMHISRDFGKTWGPPLNVDAGQAGDADSTKLSYEPHYQAFVPVWKSDVNGGVNHAFAGYVRPATLQPVGSFSAGAPVHFEGFGFSAMAEGDQMAVVISTSLAVGSVRLPNDGRDTGLLLTSMLRSSTRTPQLRAPITLGGFAVTPTIPFPPTIPAGTTIYAVAVSIGQGVGGTEYGSITDPVAITVQ